MEQTSEFCVIWLNYAILLRLWMRASVCVWFCFLFIFIEASLHNSQICPFLMTLITLFHLFPDSFRAQAGAHIHTKSFYNAYQFKMYVIFYLVLLSNFNFVHMTKMAAFSTQNQEKKRNKILHWNRQTMTRSLYFTYYKLNNSIRRLSSEWVAAMFSKAFTILLPRCISLILRCVSHSFFLFLHLKI